MSLPEREDMPENTNIVEVIHNLIKDELEEYSDILEERKNLKYTISKTVKL